MRYKIGSGIAKMWSAYESGGAAAAMAVGSSLGLAKATVKTRVEGWERERRKGGPPVAAPSISVVAPVAQPAKPMTKERLLEILRDSKNSGSSSFYCVRWLVEAQQLVKLGYAAENKKYNDAFSITEAGEKSLQRKEVQQKVQQKVHKEKKRKMK